MNLLLPLSRNHNIYKQINHKQIKHKLQRANRIRKYDNDLAKFDKGDYICGSNVKANEKEILKQLLLNKPVKEIADKYKIHVFDLLTLKRNNPGISGQRTNKKMDLDYTEK